MSVTVIGPTVIDKQDRESKVMRNLVPL